MVTDPLELVTNDDDDDDDDEDGETVKPSEETVKPSKEEATSLKKEKSKSKFNNYIAIIIALTSTFMGICKVKDDNLVQAMQQAQVNKVDNWSWYQARNIREEVANATVTQLQLQAQTQPPATRPLYAKQIAFYQQLAKRENQKKEQLKAAAENDQKQYDELNFHDDQFDLSEAFLSIAIALFAVTSLIQKRWLFGLTFIPTGLGVFMGLAGLCGWNIHPTALTKLLSDNSTAHPVVRLATSNQLPQGFH